MKKIEEKSLAELHESGATKFYLIKQCMYCSQINGIKLKTCTQCGFLFLGSATDQDKADYDEKKDKHDKLRKEMINELKQTGKKLEEHNGQRS